MLWRCSRRSRSWRSGCATCSTAPQAAPGTSSTSGTACYRRPRSRRYSGSWSGCMAAEGVAVLLMAYGGPGSLDEVEPYVLDVRGGRPTPPNLVAEIRSRYAQIGGRPPPPGRTHAPARGLGPALGAARAPYVG